MACRAPLVASTTHNTGVLSSSTSGTGRDLCALPRRPTAPTGWLAEQLGWTVFFVGCALAALPGLWVLGRLQRRGALPRHAEAVA